jgi:hypothetical protein
MDFELEDSRGVDIGQIRRQLRMTVPERVRTMVAAANVLLAIQASAEASLSPDGGCGLHDIVVHAMPARDKYLR